MHVEELRAYCLSLQFVEETFPFDESTLVFKVAGKMFAVTSLNEMEFRVNLKCDPERAIELREEFEDVIPGWHMNKKHWNTIYCERGLSNDFIIELIDHSYNLVVSKLPKKIRSELFK